MRHLNKVTQGNCRRVLGNNVIKTLLTTELIDASSFVLRYRSKMTGMMFLGTSILVYYSERLRVYVRWDKNIIEWI